MIGFRPELNQSGPPRRSHTDAARTYVVTVKNGTTSKRYVSP
ncbi:13629_t:CDS:2, partial [Racocetra persica]